MLEPNYEALLWENTEMQRALAKSKEMFEQERADKENLMTVLDDFKANFSRVSNECTIN